MKVLKNADGWIEVRLVYKWLFYWESNFSDFYKGKVLLFFSPVL